MKSKPMMMLFFILTLPFAAFAQEFNSEELDPGAEKQMLSPEEAATPEEAMASGEYERQEDVLYPVGEENSWSLESEDLPAEEYE